jgi:hypothetical protein
MTHTPGPWEIESTVSAHYIESEGCEVARVDLIGAIEGLENVDLPNARLIASAPEMLLALKALLRSRPSPGPIPWAQAEAAIAKATGGQEEK